MKSENNGWISIKDKLPNTSGLYLTFSLTGTAKYPSYDLHEFDIEENEFIFVDAWDEILYWQPLPNKPQNVNN